jgi:hypothetical protein
MPGADAMQQPISGCDLPHRSQLPAERAPDDLQDRLVHLDRPIPFSEDAGNRILDSLYVSGVCEPGAGAPDGHTPCVRRVRVGAKT